MPMDHALPDTLPVRWPAGATAPPAETDAALDRAVTVLRAGGLVAIPTETVYGLAARVRRSWIACQSSPAGGSSTMIQSRDRLSMAWRTA